jgi:hypothetical protein
MGAVTVKLTAFLTPRHQPETKVNLSISDWLRATRSKGAASFWALGWTERISALPVCTENLVRVDAVMESPKLAE